MNVGRYLRGEDLHVDTSRITKPKDLKMNDRIKELIDECWVYPAFVGTTWFDHEKFAKLIIDHFELTSLFDGIYGSELDGTRSDKGELIRHILLTENLSPAKTVMVGDRSHDAIGAKKNQLLAIGVTYGYGTEEELRIHGVDLIANSPMEITKYL